MNATAPRNLLILLSFMSLTGCLLNTKPVREGFEVISKIQLKQLVMHIEFYKLQHGQYPDTLTQLRGADELAPIYDPLIASQGNKNAAYNYKKIGEKYTLFSSGMDGIPNTKDDLYPEIDIPDSTRIGLIRPE